MTQTELVHGLARGLTQLTTTVSESIIAPADRVKVSLTIVPSALPRRFAVTPATFPGVKTEHVSWRSPKGPLQFLKLVRL